MTCENTPANARSPITAVTVVLVMTWAVLAGLGWFSYSSYHKTKATTQQRVRIEELRGSIIRLDEVLTMSARMAAFTGDPQWENRYRRFEPQLDAAIKEAIALAPAVHSSQAAAATDAANIKLVQMEKRAFDLVRQGRAEEAKAELFSHEYESQKQAYAEGMDAFTAGLADTVSTILKREQRLSFLQTGVMLLLMPVLLVAWLVVFRAVYNWKTTLAKQAKELAELNESLDQKVVERTEVLRNEVTERKLVEEALQKERDFAESLVDTAQAIILVLDTDGRIVRFNPYLEEISGYRLGEVQGKDWFDTFLPNRDRQRIRELFLTAIGDIRTRGNINCIVNKDGQEREIQWHDKTLKDGRGNTIGLLAIGHDVTERKRTGEQLQQYAVALEGQQRAMEELYVAAEAANRVKSEFLANMSHEIRTPMTAILGFADVLLGEDGLEKAPPERVKAFETIKRNGKYLLQLINDILDLSKIEAGKLEIEHVQCSPYLILSEVVSLMRVRAKAKNLSLEIEYDGPIPRNIQSDPTRLRQILINLTGNAIKFTEVGKVRLVARLSDAESDQPKMHFEVVDSGIGMTRQQIANLFKPFNQADTSTTRKHGGTGLGLTISKRLAGKLGGNIAVRSTPGEGSTFTVTVGTGPLAGVELLDNPTEAQLPTDPDKKPAAATAKLDCRVMLAEDGPDNQRLIAFLLDKAGADVTVAENGKIAHDLALAARDEGTPFDVILMDMQMPVMDGYEATGKLRQAAYTGPIIALTAHAMATDRDKCLEAGCDDYMTKPIDRKKLISIVAEYASRQELHTAGDANTSSSS